MYRNRVQIKLFFPLLPIILATGLATSCMVNPLHAQDLHFSQFHHQPLQLNPALAGVFPGDQRFAGIYRSQWVSVPVPYLTFSAGFDQKIPVSFWKGGILGAGLLFNHDQAGDASLSWSQIGLNIAGIQQLSEQLVLSAGAQFQMGQRAFQPQRLFFDEQYNGDTFDPGLPNFENFLQTAAGYTDISAGINLLFQSATNRTRISTGLNMKHLNRPEIKFFSLPGVALSPLSSVYLVSAIQIHEKLDLTVAAAAQLQGPYREILTGTGIRYHLVDIPGRQVALGTGASMRYGDALIAQGEIFYQQWRIGLSYDINISPLKIASARRGGPEISLQYIIQKAKPPDTFKVCPIF
jgi:type IX secretion system PorP/SprF family membrane protein